MKRSEQKVYRLSAPQWRALVDVATAHPRPASILSTATRKVLLGRELVTRKGHLFAITETGQHVYSRLSVGLFCSQCAKPVTFEARSLVPNVSPAKWSCLACARRSA